MFNEAYIFEVQREFDDGAEETITMEVPGECTHMELAERFNAFLTACGFVGHDYVNYKDAVRDMEIEREAEEKSTLKVIRGDLYVTGSIKSGQDIYINSTDAANA